LLWLFSIFSLIFKSLKPKNHSRQQKMLVQKYIKVTLASVLFLGNGIFFFHPSERSISQQVRSNDTPRLVNHIEGLPAAQSVETFPTAPPQASDPTLLASIFEYICASQILHKDIVIKQVIWETGWLKGKFLMSKNNLFGFRAKQYLSFSTWQESVDYYQNWQKTHYLDPKEDYYQFLVRMKFSNSNYPAHLKSIRYTGTCAS
jgi:hypothetical protein